MQVDILLIEPEDMIRKHLARVLANDGYDCHEANSLDAGIEKLRQQCYHCIVLDLDEGRRRALNLVHGLRVRRAARHFIGLHCGPERHRGAGDEPFDALIAKPFMCEPLLMTLRRLMPLTDATPLIPES